MALPGLEALSADPAGTLAAGGLESTGEVLPGGKDVPILPGKRQKDLPAPTLSELHPKLVVLGEALRVKKEPFLDFLQGVEILTPNRGSHAV
jgi:hypothetical protein